MCFPTAQKKEKAVSVPRFSRRPLPFDLTVFPEWLRVGPWRREAYVTIGVVALALIWSFPLARDTFVHDDGAACLGEEAEEQALVAVPCSPPALQSVTTRLAYAAGSVWTVGVLVGMCATIGPFWFSSYTMISWTLCTARYATGACLGPRWLRSALRFPSLAQNTVTVVVWWGVLVPLVLSAERDAARRAAFKRLNRSAFLVCVHGLNLPLAVADAVLLAPRPLTFCDLWLGLLFAFAYALFYLTCLDPRGLHFYIILSPRTRLCPVIYGALVAFYYAIFRVWQLWCSSPRQGWW